MREIKIGQRWQYIYKSKGNQLKTGQYNGVIVEVVKIYDNYRVRCLQIIGNFGGWKIGKRSYCSIGTDRHWKYLKGQDAPK